MKFLKFILLLSLLLILKCITGPPRTNVKIYNSRNEIIFVIHNRIKIADNDPPEFMTKIEGKSNKPMSGHTGLIKPASKVYEYVIIKDENNNELMNLRDETLNNAVTIETDNEDHVIYRLDVN